MYEPFLFLFALSVQYQHCLVVRDVYGTQTMSLHFYAVSETSNQMVKQSELIDSNNRISYEEILGWKSTGRCYDRQAYSCISVHMG